MIQNLMIHASLRVLTILWPIFLTLILWILPSYLPISYSSTINFGCLLFLPSLYLSALEFGLIGVIAQSLACIFLSFWISLKAHQGLALWQTFFFLGAGGCLSYLLVLFQKETVEKKIVLNDFEGHFNDFSIKYAKHKASIRAFKNKIARFSTLRLLGEKLLSTLPFDETAQKTLELTKELILKGDIITLFLLDDTLKNFKITHEFCLTDHGKAISSHPRDLFNAWTIRNRQNLLVEDLASDFRFEGISREAAPGSLIQAPLITEDKLIGAIRISSSSTQSFTLEDLRILATLTSVVSASLKNAKLYSETLELSIRDGLTGLFVFTYFHEELLKAFEAARQKGEKLCLLMADIDDFKKINDQFGHTVGDMILKKIADIFKEIIPQEACPSRYGGEEFTAFFKNASLSEIADLAEKLRSQIARTSFEIRRETFHVTVSIGVGELQPSDATKDDLLHRADLQLYQAKRNGKNRVCSG